MRFRKNDNWLLLRKNDFSECEVAHLKKNIIDSFAQVRPSGGLLSAMYAIIKVLEAFLKGHIEAIMAMVDHGQYFKIL